MSIYSINILSVAMSVRLQKAELKKRVFLGPGFFKDVVILVLKSKMIYDKCTSIYLVIVQKGREFSGCYSRQSAKL